MLETLKKRGAYKKQTKGVIIHPIIKNKYTGDIVDRSIKGKLKKARSRLRQYWRWRGNRKGFAVWRMSRFANPFNLLRRRSVWGRTNYRLEKVSQKYIMWKVGLRIVKNPERESQNRTQDMKTLGWQNDWKMQLIKQGLRNREQVQLAIKKRVIEWNGLKKIKNKYVTGDIMKSYKTKRGAKWMTWESNQLIRAISFMNEWNVLSEKYESYQQRQPGHYIKEE
jgi:hypothetical protein